MDGWTDGRTDGWITDAQIGRCKGQRERRGREEKEKENWNSNVSLA